MRKRAIIESVNDQLKNISQIEHTRHRSVTNFMVNLVAGLVAYALQPKAFFKFGFSIIHYLIFYVELTLYTFDSIWEACTEPFVGKLLDLNWSGAYENGARSFSLANYHFNLIVLPIYLGISLLLLLSIKEQNRIVLKPVTISRDFGSEVEINTVWRTCHFKSL